MDEELQKMLDELKEQKFAKMSDRQLESVEALRNSGFYHKIGQIGRSKREGLPSPLKGKKLSNQTLKNMSKSKIGHKHSSETKLKIGKKHNKPVLVYTYPDMNYVDEYESITIASENLKFNYTCAKLVLKGKRKHTSNYYLKYKE